MTTAAEYRQYAQECLDSARTATSEDIRKQFLDIAKLWMTAAEKMDAGETASDDAIQRFDGTSISPSHGRRGEAREPW